MPFSGLSGILAVMSDSHSENSDYQVLARKYRPNSFADLLGHDAMVRTLKNAFESGRIAHAWILTGVRGVGKTTTARIMARALNYEIEGGEDRPQIDMPKEGRHCAAIADSRHPDVIEMDAASRTGIDDIRDLIESVRYAPVEARYKVYIIDEVHMLSKQAFNGLLKTLEEPPPHVKFIFATTEIRKVPVTVLSRCQRFDLRRFDADILADYLQGICEKENTTVDKSGLYMIAKAAEGSVRDALSLLDQAIIQHTSSGGDQVTEQDIQQMLGLADRGGSWELLSHSLRGKAPQMLQLFRQQYDAGTDPSVILRDLLELVHLLTRVKVAGEDAAAHGPAGTAEAAIAKDVAKDFSMGSLSRSWSLLMKGLEEVNMAPDAAAAAEMALIRLCYAADLPSPAEAVRQLMEQGAGKTAAKPSTNRSKSAAPEARLDSPAIGRHQGASTAARSTVPQAALARPESQSIPVIPAQAANQITLTNLQDLVKLTAEKRDIKLKNDIELFVRIVKFEQGKIEYSPAPGAPRDLSGRIASKLKDWTGERWVVTLNMHDEGADTLRFKRDEMVRNHPMVKAVLEEFPGINLDRDMRLRELNSPLDERDNNFHPIQGENEQE